MDDSAHLNRLGYREPRHSSSAESTDQCPNPPTDLMGLAEHLQSRLHSTGLRQITGITGAPGTGKSTFARQRVDAFGREQGVIVPMDGFHLANEIAFVITEGNYLLSAEPCWYGIRPLVDEIWFLDTARELRVARLIARHIAFGMTREAATAWATGPDEANARHIESTRHLADREIRGA